MSLDRDRRVQNTPKPSNPSPFLFIGASLALGNLALPLTSSRLHHRFQRLCVPSPPLVAATCRRQHHLAPPQPPLPSTHSAPRRPSYSLYRVRPAGPRSGLPGPDPAATARRRPRARAPWLPLPSPPTRTCMRPPPRDLGREEPDRAAVDPRTAPPLLASPEDASTAPRRSPRCPRGTDRSHLRPGSSRRHAWPPDQPRAARSGRPPPDLLIPRPSPDATPSRPKWPNVSTRPIPRHVRHFVTTKSFLKFVSCCILVVGITLCMLLRFLFVICEIVHL